MDHLLRTCVISSLQPGKRRFAKARDTDTGRTVSWGINGSESHLSKKQRPTGSWDYQWERTMEKSIHPWAYGGPKNRAPRFRTLVHPSVETIIKYNKLFPYKRYAHYTQILHASTG